MPFVPIYSEEAPKLSAYPVSSPLTCTVAVQGTDCQKKNAVAVILSVAIKGDQSTDIAAVAAVQFAEKFSVEGLSDVAAFMKSVLAQLQVRSLSSFLYCDN